MTKPFSISVAVFIACCCQSYSAQQSAAIRYHSRYAITEIGTQLFGGFDLHTGRLDLEQIASDVEIDIDSIRFYDDGKEVKLPPLRHIAGFILDRRHDGEVRYEYRARYKHLAIYRETIIRDNHITLRATVSGRPIASQSPGFGISGSLWSAVLTVEASETERVTRIVLGASAVYSVDANCCLVRNAARRRAPALIRGEMSGALRRALNEARKQAVEGRASPVVMLHAALHDLSERGFRR